MNPTGQPTAVDEALAGSAAAVAQRLLGALVTANDVAVRLTEVEAYGGVGDDPASHAFRRRTTRNAPMFDEPGTLYVYFIYGMHWCANVVCAPQGTASAVLLRAGEIVDGHAIARSRARPTTRDSQLGSGPARLARALGLTGAASGSSLLDDAGPARLQLSAPTPSAAINAGARIGIRAGLDRAWRFWIGN